MRKNQKGFTLIELLIVIAIIGFLAAAILVAVDPVKRIQEARDAKRWAEVNAVLNAVLTRQVDDRALFTGGAIYDVVPSDTLSQVIIGGTSEPVAGAACVPCPDAGGLQAATPDCFVYLGGVAPTHIAAVPMDPNGGTAANTGYFFRRTTAGRITIGACNAEQAASISVTR